jgi:AmmeMemoRadiSam system protein B
MLGVALARVLKVAEGGARIVVCSDMSHYVSEEEAKRLDSISLEPIFRLDAEGLYDTVLANGLTMCGFIPATALLFALEAFRPVKAKLTAYATSAEATKNTEEVVAYAGVVFV